MFTFKKTLTLSGAVLALLSFNALATAEVKPIDLNEFKSHIGNPNAVFVDTRNDSYYNGYAEEGSLRGGHVPGAVQYTADWLGKVNDSKLANFVESKGIVKDKTIVVYDSNEKNATAVGDMLSSLGYKVQTFGDFSSYVSDSANTLDKFPHYETLVNPTWLKNLMDGKQVEGLTDTDFMLFEVSWGPIDQAKGYHEGHIKGAFHFNTDWIEEGPVWNLSSPEVLEQNLTKAGIASNKNVVLYSTDASAAFRVLFALRYAGVANVRVLNGGLEAWKNAGFELETKINTPNPVASFGVKVPQNPQFDIETAKQAMDDMEHKGLKLISIRSWDEYTGVTSGYSYIPEKGEPKGAIFGFAGSDAASMQDYYDPDNTLRNPLEMAKLWQTLGIEKGDYAAFYCGTGWRAAIPWEMTQMMGWEKFVMYDGGWNSWQMDSSLPTQVGAPEGLEKPNAQNDFN